MSITIRQFNKDLYVEHLEEASFIFEQRNAYLTDPEVTWRDLGIWDERLEAHIDALMVGGEAALSVCDERYADCDAGELNGIVRVYCRHRALSRMQSVLRAITPDDDEKIPAVAIAMRHEMPSQWREQLDALLGAGNDGQKRIAAHVLGYRRLGPGEKLTAQLAAGPSAPLANALAWSVGRVQDGNAIAALSALLKDDSPGATNAAISLLRLGDNHPVKAGHLGSHYHAWPMPALACGGGPGEVRPLLDALNAGKRGAVSALGLLGELSAVRPLLDCLGNEALAPAAANALNVITGAQLTEEQFVADDIDPDELFDYEREEFDASGQLPTRDGETPFGHAQEALTADRSRWEEWLAEHKSRFSSGTRYRNGEPCSPQSLIGCLVSESSSYDLRCAAYEELVIRYGLTVPFEADLPIPQQLAMLQKMQNWAANDCAAFEAGRWYFHGKIVS